MLVATYVLYSGSLPLSFSLAHAPSHPSSLQYEPHTVGHSRLAPGSVKSEIPVATVSLSTIGSTMSSDTSEELRAKRQGMVWTHEEDSPERPSTPTEFKHIEKFNILTLGGKEYIVGVSGKFGGMFG